MACPARKHKGGTQSPESPSEGVMLRRRPVGRLWRGLRLLDAGGILGGGCSSLAGAKWRWHCGPSSRDPSSQSLHICTGSIESTRWAAEVGGRRPSRAKADAGNSTTHNCWLAYHRSCSPPRVVCVACRSTSRENLPKKVILPLTPPCRPSPAQTKLLSRSRP